MRHFFVTASALHDAVAAAVAAEREACAQIADGRIPLADGGCEWAGYIDSQDVSEEIANRIRERSPDFKRTPPPPPPSLVDHALMLRDEAVRHYPAPWEERP